MRARKTAGLAIGGLMLAGILVVGGWVVLHPGASVSNELAIITWPHSFTATDWQAHPTQRWAMARDLAESGRLRGLTVADVEKLLSKPMANSAPLDIAVPSPGWPDDHLRVWFENGLVSGWSLNSDPEMGPTNK